MTRQRGFIYTFKLAAIGSGLVLFLSSAPLLAKAPVVDLSRQAGGSKAAPAGTSLSMEERLSKLERILSNQTLLELTQQIQQLQQQADELMGQMEESRHQLEELKKRQRDLYLDLDARLQQLEKSAVSAAPSTPGGSAAAGGSQSAAGSGRDLYQSALGGLRKQDYAKASHLFKEYLDQNPKGEYADNAQYWLGETHYVQQDYDNALKEFRKVLKNYPDSGKYSDAMLKIGLIHDAQGRYAKAQVILTELIGKYPNTPEAQIAEKRLQRIKLRSP